MNEKIAYQPSPERTTNVLESTNHELEAATSPLNGKEGYFGGKSFGATINYVGTEYQRLFANKKIQEQDGEEFEAITHDVSEAAKALNAGTAVLQKLEHQARTDENARDEKKKTDTYYYDNLRHREQSIARTIFMKLIDSYNATVAEDKKFYLDTTESEWYADRGRDNTTRLHEGRVDFDGNPVASNIYLTEQLKRFLALSEVQQNFIKNGANSEMLKVVTMYLGSGPYANSFPIGGLESIVAHNGPKIKGGWSSVNNNLPWEEAGIHTDKQREPNSSIDFRTWALVWLRKHI